MSESINSATPTKVNWTSVVTFYVLACAFSWPFFWWRDMNSESWQNIHLPNFIKGWSIMWGPGFSALICFFLFRRTHIKTISFFGSSVIKSLVFYFTPMLALCIPGIDMGETNPHAAPLLLSVIGFISIFGEELGWRGFLQDALRPLSTTKKYILIGAMWELWHFTNRMGHGEIQQIIVRVAIAMSVAILISLTIGRAVEKSHSLMIAVTFHAWVDLLFEFQSLGVYIVFALAVPFWIFILLNWDKKNNSVSTNTSKENSNDPI